MKASRIAKKQVKDVQKIKDACIKIRWMENILHVPMMGLLLL